jgi:hypothetical protein
MCSFVLTCINSPSFNADLCKLQIANTMLRLNPHYVHSHKHTLFHLTCTCIHRISLLSKFVQSNTQFLSHRLTKCVHSGFAASNFHKHEKNFIGVLIRISRAWYRKGKLCYVYMPLCSLRI